jgi:hypothetical protein
MSMFKLDNSQSTILPSAPVVEKLCIALLLLPLLLLVVRARMHVIGLAWCDLIPAAALTDDCSARLVRAWNMARAADVLEVVVEVAALDVLPEPPSSLLLNCLLSQLW